MTVTPGSAGDHRRHPELDEPEVVVLEEPRPIVAPPPVTVRPTIHRGAHPLWIGIALTSLVVLGAVLAYFLWTATTEPAAPSPTVTAVVPAPAPPPVRPTVTVVVPGVPVR